jgi:hypothetical protein
MSLFKKSMLSAVVGVLAISFGAQDASAAFSRSASGSHSMQFGLGLLTAGQDDINSLIKTARTAGADTGDMGSAYELFGQYQYRFSGTMFAMAFRPSYVMQTATGSGGGNSYDYKLTGFTFFPIFRLYPLENSFIKFYMQTGLGFGRMSGDINAGGNTIAFSGSAFGAMGGLGVDFCFTPNHCLTVEGNLRYLPLERNVATSSSGSVPGLSQSASGQEVEIGGGDLKTTMSGIQGSLAYTLNF